MSCYNLIKIPNLSAMKRVHQFLKLLLTDSICKVGWLVGVGLYSITLNKLIVCRFMQMLNLCIIPIFDFRVR